FGKLGWLPTNLINITTGFYLLLIVIDWLRERKLLTLGGNLLRFAIAAAFLLRVIRLPAVRAVTVGPFTFDFEDAGMFVLSSLMLIFLFRRIAADRREGVRLSGELQAARTIQHLLIGKSLPQDGAFPIEAAYLPAQEVGGDFYQILPGEDG